MPRSNRRDDEEEESRRAVAGVRHAARTAIFKVLPFAAQVVASAAGYTLGVTTTQVVGYALRISCASPVLGPCLGCLGVGFASALAGHASEQTRRLFEAGCDPRRVRWWEPMPADDVLTDSVMGVLVFKLMGGRFRSLMPSDLIHPGALAFESIPARGDRYAQPGMRRELARIFRRDGCHHCGSRAGPVIGDHQPPNKLLRSRVQLGHWLRELPIIKQVFSLLGAKPGRARQRFYPQCQKCSFRQASALRNSTRVLVLHLTAPRVRSEQLAGVFVGLRHNSAPYVPPGGGGGGGGDRGVRHGVPRILPLTLIAEAEASGAHKAVEELTKSPSLTDLEADIYGYNYGSGYGAPAAAAAAAVARPGSAAAAPAVDLRSTGLGGQAAAAPLRSGSLGTGTASRSSSIGGGVAEMLRHPHIAAIAAIAEEEGGAQGLAGGASGGGASSRGSSRASSAARGRADAMAWGASDPARGGASAWGSAAGPAEQQQWRGAATAQQQPPVAASFQQWVAQQAGGEPRGGPAPGLIRGYRQPAAAVEQQQQQLARRQPPPQQQLVGPDDSRGDADAAPSPRYYTAKAPGALGGGSGRPVDRDSDSVKLRAQAAFDRHFSRGLTY